MQEVEGICQNGCTVYTLWGFPYDGDGAYTKAQLAELEERLARLEHRVYILSLNSSQLEAKKILEKAGFKVLARTYTAHIDGCENEIKAWKQTMDNGNTIYLMGKGFYKKSQAGKVA